MKLDSDKIKGFLVSHFEKVILAGIIGGSGYLVYAGLKLESYTDKENPENLLQKASQVKLAIDEDHNQAILPERMPTFDIVDQTKKLAQPIPIDGYPLKQTWSGDVLSNSIVRRQDPVLHPATSVITTSVITAIAIQSRDKDDYYLADLPAAGKPGEKDKPKRRGRRKRDTSSGGFGGSGGGGIGGSAEEETVSTGPARTFDHDHGLRPKGKDDKFPVPKIGWFISGRAVVPHKKLHESYKLALKEAAEYDARRDAPSYFDFEVQRADVTDKSVDQLTEEDWSLVWDRLLYTTLAADLWSGFAPELVPSDYRDDALTMWIPPVLLDDYDSFSLHPLIPRLSRKELKAEAGEEDESVTEDNVDIFAEDFATLAVPGGGGGAPVGLGGMSDGGGMVGAMGAQMMNRGVEEDPVEYKMIRFYDFGALNLRRPAKYGKDPVAGRQYVYRVRYAVNDPNFPFSPSLQPKTSSLAPEVAARVSALVEKIAVTNERDFRRWSDWSEPSEPVSLASREIYYAGPVSPGSTLRWQLGGKIVEYARSEPSAKILASQYDLDSAGRIPLELDITEGSVLSKKADSADVVDPISLEIKSWEDAELVSGTTIVDLSGGQKQKIDSSGLADPGLMLLSDEFGQLHVSDEISDFEFFQVYTYVESEEDEKDKKKK